MVMMMLRLTVLLSLLASAAAVPALVWNSEQPSDAETVYTSSQIKPEELLRGADDKSAVVFLLARNAASGSESLTELAPQLSRTAESQPSEVHRHVSEMRNGAFLDRQARQQGRASSLVVNLSELSSRLSPREEEEEEEQVVVDAAAGTTVLSKTQAKKSKRAQQLAQANLLIVNVDPAAVEPQLLDEVVMRAVNHDSIDRVVLTAVRGVDEVKRERYLLEQRRLQSMEKAGRRLQQQSQSSPQRRRLEDADQEDGGEEDGDGNNGQQQQNNNNNNDLEGVYYVSLTPNIFAGILFFLMFTTVTFIGISCMGMIAGQDLYVNKMPTIGREA